MPSSLVTLSGFRIFFILVKYILTFRAFVIGSVCGMHGLSQEEIVLIIT